MKTKIVGILVMTLLITTLLPITGTVLAGDEEHPEITDGDEDDIFGPLVSDPELFARLKSLGALEGIESFEFLDIISAWFYEDFNEPDFLYTSIKIKDLGFFDDRGIYSVHWRYNEVDYAAGVHTHSNGDYSSFFAGESPNGPYSIFSGSFDLENNIVTFRVPKVIIGNPQPGDVLTDTWAWTALRFKIEPATWPFGGELAKDAAPFITDIEDYGEDYVIQYQSVVPYLKKISGTTSPNIGVEYRYLFTALDPNEDDVYYYIDWGDGNIDEWIGPYASGEDVIFSHMWDESGSYSITAKVRNTNGYESDIVTLDLTAYTSKVMNRSLFLHFLQNLLQQHPHLFPILRQLLKL